MFKLLVVILLWFSALAWAETLVGPYLGAGMGYAYISHDTNRNATDNVGAALNLYAGYSFNEYIALDIGAAVMPYEAYIKHDPYSLEVTHSVITDLALRLGVPLSDFVNGYIEYKPELHIGYTYFKYWNVTESDKFKVGLGYAPFVFVKPAWSQDAPVPLPGVAALAALRFYDTVNFQVWYTGSLYFFNFRIDF